MMARVEDDPHRRSGWTTALLTLLTIAFVAWAALPAAGLDTNRYTVALTALTEYAVIVGIVLLVLNMRLGRWLNVLVVAIVTALLAYSVLPRALPGQAESAAGTPVKVLSMNTYLGRADADQLVAAVRDNRVDVLSLQELTPDLVSRLQAAGLFAELPNRVLHPDPGGAGTGIVSRYPLHELNLVPSTVLSQPSALVDIPGRDLTVVAVHTFWPMGSGPTIEGTVPMWQHDLRALPEPDYADGPLVLAGDFNATLDMTLMKAMIGRGYIDAAAATGHGIAPTWPSSWLPPPVTIDHVLTAGGVRPEDYRVLDIPGSDHRAILATLRVAP